MSSLLFNSFHPLSGSVKLFFSFASLLFLFSKGNSIFSLLFLFSLVFSMFLWSLAFLKDESGDHYFMMDNLTSAMLMFITSEALLFATFFWSWFNHKWSPFLSSGGNSVSFSVSFIDPWAIPILNTFLLLSSAVTVTIAHHFLITGKMNKILSSMILTIFLAFIFLTLQYFEYKNSGFSMSDSNYGSLFFMLTGFHGAHVLLGLILLVISFIVMLTKRMLANSHLFFELAVYYYHFVDVVWLGLFVWIYL